MKNSTQKSIKRLSIATLIIGGLALAYLYWEMIAQLWVDSYIVPLTWNPDVKGWQIFILATRFIGFTALFILCCIFLHRTNRGLANGEIDAGLKHYPGPDHRPALCRTLQNGLPGR